MDITREINRHLDWIEVVSSMLGDKVLGEDELEQITRHDRCALGQWLQSPAASEAVGGGSVLDPLRSSHERFHALAGALVAALQAGDENRAIALQQDFVDSSQDIIGHLHALERKADATGGSGGEGG
jgi:hypothetical protein